MSKIPTIIMSDDCYCFHLEAYNKTQHKDVPATVQPHLYDLHFTNADLFLPFEDVMKDIIFIQDYVVIRSENYESFASSSSIGYSVFIDWAENIDRAFKNWENLISCFDKDLSLQERERSIPNWLEEMKFHIEFALETGFVDSITKDTIIQTKDLLQEKYMREGQKLNRIATKS